MYALGVWIESSSTFWGLTLFSNPFCMMRNFLTQFRILFLTKVGGIWKYVECCDSFLIDIQRYIQLDTRYTQLQYTQFDNLCILISIFSITNFMDCLHWTIKHCCYFFCFKILQKKAINMSKYRKKSLKGLYIRNRWSQTYYSNHNSVSKNVNIYVMTFLKLKLQFYKNCRD